jgi:hypothetical protein
LRKKRFDFSRLLGDLRLANFLGDSIVDVGGLREDNPSDPRHRGTVPGSGTK